MIFLEPVPDLNTDHNKRNMAQFNKHVGSGKQAFLFLYMDGCGPCNMTKQSWAEIQHHVKKPHLSNNNVIVAQINKDLFNNMQHIGQEPMGFPTLRYINHKGKVIEEYESGRRPEDFAMWIESKLDKSSSHHSHNINSDHKKTHKSSSHHSRNINSDHKKTHKSHHTMMGGSKKKRRHKWSRKYKKSINCRRPKGFSQRQYCKYGRKK